MAIVYDEAKRTAVLAERGLDFNDAEEAFLGFHLTRRDVSHSDEEDRFQTLGLIAGSLVLIVWTPRGDDRRIITMWKANDRERAKFESARRDSG
jgi:uncharacterized DUF497 family protein